MDDIGSMAADLAGGAIMWGGVAYLLGSKHPVRWAVGGAAIWFAVGRFAAAYAEGQARARGE